jgi:hypothetical protein
MQKSEMETGKIILYLEVKPLVILVLRLCQFELVLFVFIGRDNDNDNGL